MPKWHMRVVARESFHGIDIVSGQGMPLLLMENPVFAQQVGNEGAAGVQHQIGAVHRGIHGLDGADVEQDIRIVKHNLNEGSLELFSFWAFGIRCRRFCAGLQ